MSGARTCVSECLPAESDKTPAAAIPLWRAARLLYPVSMDSGSVFAIIVNAAIFIGLWVIDIRPRHKTPRNTDPQREDEASSTSSSAS